MQRHKEEGGSGVKHILNVAAAALVLAGCGGNTAYKDGVYTGVSGKDEIGAYGEVSITITNGKIADCAFVTRQRDGTIKDENYGKVGGQISIQDYYNKAQLAVRAMARYAREYVETKDLDAVQAVSGATIAYNQFIEAVENALEGAQK
jgi:major membrane immunogen (membrane-anchored lipoprotein)